MAQPKEPRPLPKIASYKTLSKMRAGETAIVGPCKPNQISADFARLGGEWQQQIVLVVEPRSATCQKMFMVSRVK